MPGFTLTTGAVLAAPPGVVWGRLDDREAQAAWCESLASLSGGRNLPTRRTTDPCSYPIVGTVEVMEPARRLAVTFRAPWRLLRSVALDVTLEPADDGTRLQGTVTYALRPLGALLRPLVRLRAEIALHRVLRGLRAATETESARIRKVGRLAHARAEAEPSSPGRSAASQDALLLRTAI